MKRISRTRATGIGQWNSPHASLVGMAALSLALASPALAADFAADNVFTWRSTGGVYNLEEGHIAFLGDLGGLSRAAEGSFGPLAGPISMLCPIFSDVGNEAITFCVGTDADGDQVFMRSEGHPIPPDQWVPGAIGGDAGEYTIYAGTGKFVGISGVLSFQGNSMGFLSDGSLVGFTTLVGPYSVPDR